MKPVLEWNKSLWLGGFFPSAAVLSHSGGHHGMALDVGKERKPLPDFIIYQKQNRVSPGIWMGDNQGMVTIQKQAVVYHLC